MHCGRSLSRVLQWCLKHSGLVLCYRGIQSQPQVAELLCNVAGSHARYDHSTCMCVVQVTDAVRLEPGERRRRMHVLHLCFGVSPVPRSVVVTVDVTTPLLFIDEYPADASRGFDVPASRISVPSAAALEATSPQWQCTEHVSRAFMQLEATTHHSVRALHSASCHATECCRQTPCHDLCRRSSVRGC